MNKGKWPTAEVASDSPPQRQKSPTGQGEVVSPLLLNQTPNREETGSLSRDQQQASWQASQTTKGKWPTAEVTNDFPPQKAEIPQQGKVRCPPPPTEPKLQWEEKRTPSEDATSQQEGKQAK